MHLISIFGVIFKYHMQPTGIIQVIINVSSCSSHFILNLNSIYDLVLIKALEIIFTI